MKTPYTDIISWFDSSNLVELNYTDTDEEFNANLLSIKPLVALANEYCGRQTESEQLFAMELVLWTLAVSNKLDRIESDSAFSFDATGSRLFYGDN